ncbi:MAG: hypothetical protein RLZZ342_86 [Candidatus Parcubacteria bacterium]|jgi:hypothetical protein
MFSLTIKSSKDSVTGIYGLLLIFESKMANTRHTIGPLLKTFRNSGEAEEARNRIEKCCGSRLWKDIPEGAVYLKTEDAISTWLVTTAFL